MSAPKDGFELLASSTLPSVDRVESSVLSFSLNLYFLLSLVSFIGFGICGQALPTGRAGAKVLTLELQYSTHFSSIGVELWASHTQGKCVSLG